MRANELKRKLAAGETVIGGILPVPSARLAEIVCLTGLDFVVIDMEHGPIDIGVAEEMVRAVELRGATPIVRITHNSPHLMLRALDIGAFGVHVPDVNTVEDAQRAATSSKYGPKGHRGLAGVRAADYGLQQPLSEYAPVANRETMVIAHIESEPAIRNLDALLEVEGVDVYYLGPEDISNSLGIPGQSKDPRVVRLVEDAIRRIAARGRIAGCTGNDAAGTRRLVDLGARYIACHPIRLLAAATREFLAEVGQ
jgi:4-hydroxy-2-oxoheptanedioate aldolase